MVKKKLAIAAVAVMILLGLGLMFYPWFSNWYTSNHQGEVIQDYQETLSHLSDRQMREYKAEAEAYNQRLFEEAAEDERETYDMLLNINGDGLMGYIEIPEIEVYLPIYHGTTDEILAKGAGHLFPSSLPVGGVSTHSILSAHCGDPTADFFTHLDELQEGDYFLLHILDDVLCYEVDQIKVVLPHETEDFQIEAGKDYVTLVTCTPYGINSHRLLVRGSRTERVKEERIIERESSQQPAAGSIPYPEMFGLAAVIGGILYAVIRRKGRRK